MDIENLNKMQIVLLTLLVSFVTSIATGIVTVTLMDQAPPVVTQTIHKVVEKTVENVAPKSQVATVNKEVVIVKEQNIIADVVEKNTKSVVRIIRKSETGSSFISLGVIIDKTGLIVTSSENIDKDKNYSITLDGEKIDLEILKINSEVAYLKTITPEGSIFKPIFKVADFATADSLKLGQSVVMLGGIKSVEVFTGIISGLTQEEVASEETKTTTATTTENVKEPVVEKYISNIKTNIPNTDIVSGAPLLNLKGEIIGINIDSSTNSFDFINISKEEIENLLTKE